MIGCGKLASEFSAVSDAALTNSPPIALRDPENCQKKKKKKKTREEKQLTRYARGMLSRADFSPANNPVAIRTRFACNRARQKKGMHARVAHLWHGLPFITEIPVARNVEFPREIRAAR